MKDKNSVMNSAVTLERIERLPEQGRETPQELLYPGTAGAGRALCRQTMEATAASGWACFL